MNYNAMSPTIGEVDTAQSRCKQLAAEVARLRQTLAEIVAGAEERLRATAEYLAHSMTPCPPITMGYPRGNPERAAWQDKTHALHAAIVKAEQRIITGAEDARQAEAAQEQP